MLTCKQAAEILGIHAKAVNQYVRIGRIVGIKQDGLWYIDESEVERYKHVLESSGGRRKPKSTPVESRFWERVQKTKSCWLWTGLKNELGYGLIRIRYTPHRAHRVAWEITYGKIPDGFYVCHACDNPSCVRPDHLMLGTSHSNMTDMRHKGRGTIPPVRYGEQNNKTKLNADIVRDIRRKYATGNYTYKQLGSEYSISYATIRQVVIGRTWQYVQDE
jgi:hypothetical protein